MDTIINTQLLDEITNQAKQSPRLRMNYNLHRSLDAKAQRLLNVLEPGTVIPIHRHRETDETYILLRGKLLVEYYNDDKEISDTITLDIANGDFGMHVPAGQWHRVEALESGTTIFEVKDGPYQPLSDEDILV